MLRIDFEAIPVRIKCDCCGDEFHVSAGRLREVQTVFCPHCENEIVYDLRKLDRFMDV